MRSNIQQLISQSRDRIAAQLAAGLDPKADMKRAINRRSSFIRWEKFRKENPEVALPPVLLRELEELAEWLHRSQQSASASWNATMLRRQKRSLGLERAGWAKGPWFEVYCLDIHDGYKWKRARKHRKGPS